MTQVESPTGQPPNAPYPSAAELPHDARAGLLTFLLALTDTKQRLGFQTSHWVTGTPAIEGAVGAAALAQDELGHARTLYALLRTFPGAPEWLGEENDLKSTRPRFHPPALDPRWPTWLGLIAVNVTLDAALHEVFQALRASGYGPLAAAAHKITQEERFHRVFGDAWLTRLAGMGGDLKAGLQAQLDWAYAAADAWLGPDGADAALVEAGLIAEAPSDLRAPWRQELGAKLERAGLALPPERRDWSAWTPARREGSGAPAEQG